MRMVETFGCVGASGHRFDGGFLGFFFTCGGGLLGDGLVLVGYCLGRGGVFWQKGRGEKSDRPIKLQSKERNSVDDLLVLLVSYPVCSSSLDVVSAAGRSALLDGAYPLLDLSL